MAFVLEGTICKAKKITPSQLPYARAEIDDFNGIPQKGLVCKPTDIPAGIPWLQAKMFRKTETVLREVILDQKEAVRDGQARDTFKFKVEQGLSERPQFLGPAWVAAPTFAEIEAKIVAHQKALEEQASMAAQAQALRDGASAEGAVFVQSSSRLSRPSASWPRGSGIACTYVWASCDSGEANRCTCEGTCKQCQQVARRQSHQCSDPIQQRCFSRRGFFRLHSRSGQSCIGDFAGIADMWWPRSGAGRWVGAGLAQQAWQGTAFGTGHPSWCVSRPRTCRGSLSMGRPFPML
jgi:hypothetical protein